MYYNGCGSASCSSDPGAVKDLGSAIDLLCAMCHHAVYCCQATGLYLDRGRRVGKRCNFSGICAFDHVRRRFTAWKDPWADIDNTGYQITQVPFRYWNRRLV